MSKETGGSAFPVTPHPNGGPLNNGMSLRDYFAAKALQSLIGDMKRKDTVEILAQAAYIFADAMIEERNK